MDSFAEVEAVEEATVVVAARDNSSIRNTIKNPMVLLGR